MQVNKQRGHSVFRPHLLLAAVVMVAMVCVKWSNTGSGGVLSSPKERITLSLHRSRIESLTGVAIHWLCRQGSPHSTHLFSTTEVAQGHLMNHLPQL